MTWLCFLTFQELTTPLRDGWGITSNGNHLIVSNSTATLTWIDSATMQAVREVTVTGGLCGVRSLLWLPTGICLWHA